MNLLYEDYPKSIDVKGRQYEIITDFREWVRFGDTANSDKLTELEKVEIFKKYFVKTKPRDLTGLINGLIGFYSCNGIPKAGKPTKGDNASKVVFSYAYDAMYVIGAFRQVYGIDLKAVEYMHWWEFKGLLEALSEDCPLKQRISYRGINLAEIKDNKERARIRKVQNAIWLPESAVKDENIGDIFGGMV